MRLMYHYGFKERKINFYTDLPEAKHVTCHLGIVVAERIIAHGAPISTVIDLQSSHVVQSTTNQSYASCV